MKIIAQNRRARHELEVLETLEAGIVLQGSEVKSLRAGKCEIVDGFVRIEQGEAWTGSAHHWTRRAAMMITLPWTKQNHPKPQELEIRQRVLGWAVRYVRDENWVIQKSVAGWLRDLGKHDPERVEYFLANNAKNMKPFARKEAQKHLPKKE